MIKNITVTFRGMIESIIHPTNPNKEGFNSLFEEGIPKPSALISIVSHTVESLDEINLVPNWVFKSPEEMNKFKDFGCREIHQMWFGDVTEKHEWKDDIFTKEQAQEVIDFINFVNNDPDITDLIIHCDAGISRSGAVAVFASRFLNIDENIVRSKRKIISPNPHVLGLLMEVSGLNEKIVSVFDSLPIGEDIIKKSCKEIHKMVMERTRKESKGKSIQQNFLGSINRELESIWPELIEFFKKNKHLIEN